MAGAARNLSMSPDAVRKREQRAKSARNTHLDLWWPKQASYTLHDLMAATGLDEAEALAWAVHVGRRMASTRGPILIEPPKKYVPRDTNNLSSMPSFQDQDPLAVWVDDDEDEDDD